MTPEQGHWSAARFQAWDLCPTTYRERYVDGIAQEVSEAMRFGAAVHGALEAHFCGADGDRAFKAVWRPSSNREALLSGVGLHLLGLVYDLGLDGEPESYFELDTTADWLKPTIGYIDLVDYRNGHIYDFKTTIGAWGEGRANQDPWQPALYRHAIAQRTGDLFEFSYVTLNKRTLELAMVQPTTDYHQIWADCQVAAAMIAKMDAAGSYPCRGGHGTCPECAGSWAHGHVCDWTLRPPRIHITRPLDDGSTLRVDGAVSNSG
jgi:hypothetical protein